MGVLEGLVVATIVLAGAYVGYHAWQESLEASPGAEAHSIGTGHAGGGERHAAEAAGSGGYGANPLPSSSSSPPPPRQSLLL